MTVEIDRDTYRLLSQIAAMGRMSPDEAAEEIIRTFLRDVVVSSGESVRDQLLALGHLREGKVKGVLARAAKLSPTRRREIASLAARTRWDAAKRKPDGR